MFSVNQYRTPLINDLYDLVNFNTSIESLADDICEVCKAFYHQGREEAIDDMKKLLNSKNATINFSEQTDVRTITLFIKDSNWLEERLKEQKNE